jgi:hypothetical protein
MVDGVAFMMLRGDDEDEDEEDIDDDSQSFLSRSLECGWTVSFHQHDYMCLCLFKSLDILLSTIDMHYFSGPKQRVCALHIYLYEFHVGCQRITNVNCLTHVHNLDLSYCHGISDVSGLKNVHTLSLRNCSGVSDVSALGKSYALNLSGCEQVHFDSTSPNRIDDIYIYIDSGRACPSSCLLLESQRLPKPRGCQHVTPCPVLGPPLLSQSDWTGTLATIWLGNITLTGLPQQHISKTRVNRQDDIRSLLRLRHT